MKKIFLFLVLIISLRGLSQYPIQQNLGSSSTLVRVPPNGAFKANLINAIFIDTIAANTTNIKFYAGAQIFTTGVGLPVDVFTNVIWTRDLTATKWIAGGGAAINNITNIYNNSVVNWIISDNDSCVILQNGSGTNVDTICFNFVICNVYFLSSTQLVACTCADTTTQTPTCDTATISSQNFYVFQNGLWQRAAGIVEFGGGNGLLHNTDLNTNYYTMTFSGQPVYNYPYQFYNNQYFQGSTAIASFLSHGYGVSPLVPISTRLGINFTGDDYNGIAPNNVGYFNNQRVYWIGTNTVGYGSFGLKTDDNRSKNVGITFNTYDSTLTDGMSFYASPQGLATNNVLPRATLYNYRFLVGHTTGKVELPKYTLGGTFEQTDTTNYKPAIFDANGNFYRLDHWPSGTTVTPAGNYGDIQINRNNVFSTPASDSLIYNSARLTVLGHQTITSANTTGTTTSASLVLNANSLTSGTGFYAASSTLGAGSLMDLQINSTAAASNTQKGINILTQGANSNSNQSTYGLYTNNTHTGTGSINYGLASIASGGGTNYGVYGSASTRGVFGAGGTYGVYGSGSSNGVYGESGITGVYGTTTSGSGSGTGVLGATNGIDGQVGVYALANTGGLPFRAQGTNSSTNTVRSIAEIDRRVVGGGGSAANGIGGSIDFYNDDDNSGSNDLTLSNQVISKWTNATHATRTSQYSVKGVVNTISDDMLKMGDFVTLTESSATTFATTTVSISAASGKMNGGEIIVTITANDGTDYQSRTLRFIWTAVYKAGTLTITLGTPEEVVAASSGTLTATITAIDSGSGVIDFQANAVSSLTQTTLRCSYTFIKNF